MSSAQRRVRFTMGDRTLINLGSRFFLAAKNKVAARDAIQRVSADPPVNESFEEELRTWGWGCRKDHRGNVVGLYVAGDDVDAPVTRLIFKAIAPFVRPRSFVSFAYNRSDPMPTIVTYVFRQKDGKRIVEVDRGFVLPKSLLTPSQRRKERP